MTRNQKTSLCAIVLFVVLISACAQRQPRFCEPCEQAARFGVNYRQALAQAEKGNARALSVLFRVADKLDGAGAETYCGDLERLLKMYGDAKFAALLSKEADNVRGNVLSSLDFAFDVYEHHERWSKKFPATFHAGTHKFHYRPWPETQAKRRG